MDGFRARIVMHQTEDSGRLAAIHTGQPKELEDPQGTWYTGFYKVPVSGSVFVNATNLEGDGQADLDHHGGIDKAVLAYSVDNYSTWKADHGFDFPLGGFGENLSILGIDEAGVCIGDRWEICGAVFEVSQPRQPCWKLGRRWNNPLLPKLVVTTGHSGWYLRVIQTGTIRTGALVTLVSRAHPEWTVVRANQVFYGKSQTLKNELACVPQLSAAWKQSLRSD